MVKISKGIRLAEYLTVSQAAEFLGVSAWTLRNWDKAGKFKPSRHPKNSYRIYRREDLKRILDSIPSGSRPNSGLAPQFDWKQIGPSEHFVQFYEKDSSLINSVTRFIAFALRAGDAALIIATKSHRNAIQKRLQRQGLDLSTALLDGRLVILDAAETLDKFFIDGVLDQARFADMIDGIIPLLKRDGRKLRAFGEMVALLLTAGRRADAIRLEELWNDVVKVHPLALFCAYPIHGFAESRDVDSFGTLCNCHSRVIPAESYADLQNPEEQLRQISSLQQKATTLKAEIDRRRLIENSLSLAQEAAQNATNAKNHFLTALHNDLRTTLQPTLISAAAMEADPALPPHLRDQLIIIRQAINSELQFVADLLASSHTNSD